MRERRDQGCSGITRVKTHLVSEQKVYSSVHGEERGWSGGGHVGKAAGARCGRILFLVQHAFTNTFMNLPLAPLSTDGLLRRSNRQAGMCYISTWAWGGGQGNFSMPLFCVCQNNQMEELGLTWSRREHGFSPRKFVQEWPCGSIHTSIYCKGK